MLFSTRCPGKTGYAPGRNLSRTRYGGAFFEGDGIGAQLTLLPLQACIQGRPVSMGGIAGVATWPENRRQGYVAHLLTHALKTMNENGQTLSFFCIRS
ncbi:GNAT family N-acetyltransferase [Paenibacillus rhizoplanae]